MIKTSPIEMTVDTFGSLTFIVETNAESRRSENHCGEKSFLELKHSHAKGIEARYTTDRYKRDFRGCSRQRTYSKRPPSGEGLLPEDNGGDKQIIVVTPPRA